MKKIKWKIIQILARLRETFIFRIEKITEFYLFPSLVFYKNSNENIKWIETRFNLFVLQIDCTFLYRR